MDQQTKQRIAAWHGVVTLGGVQAGDRVLVLDADGSGSIGAITIARQHNADVITHGRDDASDMMLTASPENLRDALFALTDGKPVDMVVDCSGGDIVRPALRCLKWLGTYVSLSGSDAEVPANYPLIKGLTVLGVDVDAMLADPSPAEQQSISAAQAA